MKQSDIALLMKGMAPVIGKLIGDAVQPFVERIAELEQVIAALPAPKEVDEDQRAQDAAQVQAWMDRVEEKFASLPEPVEPKEFDPEEVRGVLAEELERAVAALPKPEDGKSVTVEDVAPLIEQAVSKAVAGIRVPADGVGLAGAIQDHKGNLVITLTNGTTVDVGQVAGKDADMDALRAEIKELVDAIPRPRDGFGFDDIDIVVADDGVALKFTRGEEVKAFALPVPFYRGVFSAEKSYRKGNTVTWGGSLWIALKDAPAGKPDAPDSDWVLSVKKGQSAK
jgi:hypothetical protein